MPVLERNVLPNAITVARILAAPALFFLVFVPDFTLRFLAFWLFTIAALSDLWDGHLARKYGWISDFGKLADPIADKMLLVAAFVPFYILSHDPDRLGVGPLPFWGELPLWILLVIFGREALITVLRAYAARRGAVIPAGKAGKYKAFIQNIFIGSTLLWYALQTLARPEQWTGEAWVAWTWFHSAVLVLSLMVAVVLTLYSLGVYLWGWRKAAPEATG